MVVTSTSTANTVLGNIKVIIQTEEVISVLTSQHTDPL